MVLEFEKIQELVGKELNPFDKSENHFLKYDWIDSLNDDNQGAYDDGVIKFSTEKYAKDVWIDYHSSYITLPLAIYGSTDFASAGVPSVCLKNGLTQLIYSIQLDVGTKNIQNARRINMYNHIKQMVDIDVNYAESQGSLWHFAKDTLDSSDPAEFVATPFPALSAVGVGLTAGVGAQPLTGTAGAGSTTILNARNPAFNKGALNRIQFLTPYYFQKGAIYYYTLRAAIPVKLISGFFEQLDFPLFNVPMKMNLGLCGTQAGPQTTPFMASGLGAGVSVQFAIGNADINHPAIESKCKWYLPKVEFTPKITTLLAPHLEKGLIKKVIFYSARTEQNLATTNTLDKELTNGIKSPRRIWTVLQPKGSAALQNSASPCIATGSITNVNLQIGADNFYKNDLKYDYEMYMIFKQQQFHSGDDFSSGSQVSFNDFANGVHKYHVIDLARKDFNPADNIPLFFTATIGKNGVPDSANAYSNYDIFHSVEHELEVVINMTNQDVFVNGTV